MKVKIKTYTGLHIGADCYLESKTETFKPDDKRLVNICTECPYPKCIERSDGCARYSAERRRILGNKKKRPNRIGAKTELSIVKMS